MTDNVHAIHGSLIASERRKEFLNDVANVYDLYTKDNGFEPEAIVFVLGGIGQAVRVAYSTDGETQKGPTSMLALAQAAIMKRFIRGIEG